MSSLSVRRLATLLCALLSVGAIGSVPVAANAAGCDRPCLKTLLDGYLSAVVHHDPSAAQLAGSYRHTENAINVPLGKGVWQSVTGLGQVQRRYLDPVSGQAAYYGIVTEGERLVIVTARLRIEDRRITEAEWYMAREEDPGLPGSTPPSAWNPQSLTASPPPVRTLSAAQRLPRDTMVAIVNSYFDGITSHDGAVVRAHAGCNRYENGTRVTGRRGGVNDDCVSGLQNFNLANVAARRVAFVDEEAGVVLGMAVFIRRPGATLPRNAFSEWFWIEDGKIRNIWTAMYYPGADRPVPNWPPFDGNFPLPATAAATPSREADLAAIMSFNTKYLKAINDGDITALGALTDEDHIALVPGTAPLVGKAANLAANGRAYQQFKIEESWAPVETVIDGNLAYQRGSFTVIATPKAGGESRSTSGSFMRIYRRQADGAWIMTRDMFNTGPAAGPAH